MAHEVESMISTKGIVPWHKLGVVVQKMLVTAEDIIREIGFDFKVEKRQNITTLNRNGQSELVKLTDSYSTVRVNKDGMESVLCGKVGKDYTPIQNVDAFGFFDNIVGNGEAVYETAGILKRGRAIFLLAVLPDYIKILGSEEDTIKKYVLLANWHDGTSALLAMFTDVRVVCNNTLNMALSSAQSQVKIRHTASAEERMKEAMRTMGLVNQYNVELEKAFNKMAVAKMHTDQLLKYVHTLLPVDEMASDTAKKNAQERREMVLVLADKGHGSDLDTARGTVWGAYNAYTEFVDHGSNFRSEDGRAASLLVGDGRARKQRAFDLAMQFATDLQPLSNISRN